MSWFPGVLAVSAVTTHIAVMVVIVKILLTSENLLTLFLGVFVLLLFELILFSALHGHEKFKKERPTWNIRQK